MGKYDDAEILLTFKVTVEYELTEGVAAMAKYLGTSKRQIVQWLKDGDTPDDVKEGILTSLTAAATVTNEEIEFTELSSDDLDD